MWNLLSFFGFRRNIGWFFSYYVFVDTGLNSSVLFHCQTSSAWSIIYAWVVINEQRLPNIEFYYQNGCSVKKFHRVLLPFYGQFNWPIEVAIRTIVTKFHIKFTLLDIKLPTRLPRVRTEEYIAAVSASVNAAVRCNWTSVTQQCGKFSGSFQNTADTRIEIKQRTSTQNFWWMGSWKVGRRSSPLSKNCVQRLSLFLA